MNLQLPHSPLPHRTASNVQLKFISGESVTLAHWVNLPPHLADPFSCGNKGRPKSFLTVGKPQGLTIILIFTYASVTNHGYLLHLNGNRKGVLSPSWGDMPSLMHKLQWLFVERFH